MELKRIFFSSLLALMLSDKALALKAGVSDGGGDELPNGTYWSCAGGDGKEGYIEVHTDVESELNHTGLSFIYGKGPVSTGFEETYSCQSYEGLTVGPELIYTDGILNITYKMTGNFTYSKNIEKVLEKNSSITLQISIPPSQKVRITKEDASYAAEVSYEDLPTGKRRSQKLVCTIQQFKNGGD